MLLKKEHDPIQSGGLGVGGEFSIANSPKAFEILSSNLYQDKQLAVIREISCNAADAHRLVGKKLADIKIHLPTYGQPHFSVRDFGPGLSQQDVIQLYTTYFLSSKDSNNDLIGGFGLGSKSPFSLVDQFTVTSWFNGFQSNYVMYKDAGVPKVNMVSSTPCTPDNTGIEVRLAVAGDYSVWHTKANEFFSWWPELPSFNGGVSIKSMLDPKNVLIKSATTLSDYPEWAIFKNTYGYTNSIAFMGLVPYRLSASAIPKFPDHLRTFIDKKQLVFAFNVGELSISPSREALSYDPDTCAALINRFEEVYKDFEARAAAAIKDATTMAEARELVWGANGVRETHGHTVANRLKWNGKPIPNNVHLPYKGSHNLFDADLTVTSLSYRSYYRKKWRRDSDAPINDDFDYQRYNHSKQAHRYIWFPNITAKTYRDVEFNYEQEAQNDGNNWHMLIIAGSTYAAVCKVFEDCGVELPFDGSTLPPAPKAVPGAKGAAAPPTQGYVFTGGAGSYERTEVAIDLKDGGIAIEFFDGAIVKPIEPLRAAFRYGWFATPPAKVIGFRRAKLESTRFQKTLADNDWAIYTEDFFKKEIKPDDIRKTQKAITFSSGNFTTSIGQIFPLVAAYKKQHGAYPTWAKLDASLASIADVFSMLIDQHVSTSCSGGDLTYSIGSNWLTTDQADAIALGKKEGAQAQQDFAAFLAAHPLLAYIFTYNYNSKPVKLEDLHEYLNR